MAAPEPPAGGARRPSSPALAALTAAALALPGLTAGPAEAADGDSVIFDVQHYQEGERNLDGRAYGDLNLKPLRADSLAVGMTGDLSDRVTFGFTYSQDTWSGATPVATVPEAAINDQIYSGASKPLVYYADGDGHPVDVNWDSFDGTSVQFSRDPRLVHVMGSASPETRRQGEVKLGYAWTDLAVNLSGGLSDEPDYRSIFGAVGARLDLNRKLTTLDWSLSYTSSDIHASLEANTAADWGAYADQINDRGGVNTLYGQRRDSAGSVGVTQVLNKDALVSASLGYTHSAGYLANPYKAAILAFDDPGQFIDSTGLRTVILKGVLEERPRVRNQWTADLRVVQYVRPLSASLHLDYRFYHDDWGIDAHTLDASWYQPLGGGWMATLGGRYYTQTQAGFYRPYYLFDKAMPVLGPINPELPRRLDFSQIPLRLFSSDERLSGFGALSGRLAISKAFGQGFRLEAGGELSTHKGSLKLGGGGEGRYADFNAYTVFTSLKVDLTARGLGGAIPLQARLGEDRFSAPAGVSLANMLDKAGEISVGYRHSYARRGAELLHGTVPVTDDQTLIDRGCDAVQCQLAPVGSSTNVSELDLMYAPTDWLTLVVTPQLVERHQDVRPLQAAPLPEAGIGHPGLGGGQPNYRHSAGGIGDTGVYALFRLWDSGRGRLHLGLGFSAPTGDSGIRQNTSRDFAAYDLQLGDGVWDFRPTLTYQGTDDRLTWGMQINGIKRLQSSNAQGYASGDSIQASAWGGLILLDWLTASARGVGRIQGAASGGFAPQLTPTLTGYRYEGNQAVGVYSYDLQPHTVTGPMDLAASQGGRYWDIGLGLSAMIPNGPLAGNRISVEWLQPLHDDVHGYQLKRSGTLSVSWGLRL